MCTAAKCQDQSVKRFFSGSTRIRSPVAARGDVIHRTGEFDMKWASHEGRLHLRAAKGEA